MRGETNLLDETLSTLAQHALSRADVRWVGTVKRYDTDERAPVLGTWADFEKAANFTYDAGYGGEEVNMRLVVVGDDWWLERHEYDGSEWWEFKRLPAKPQGATQPITSDSLKERP